jgi:hypothetical protein
MRFTISRTCYLNEVDSMVNAIADMEPEAELLHVATAVFRNGAGENTVLVTCLLDKAAVAALKVVNDQL